MSLTWEWVAPNGERVSARLDAAEGLESIYVGPRLISRSKLGARPDGHPIPQRSVADGSAYRQPVANLVVTYDPRRGAFDLHANGDLVLPTVQPLAAGATSFPSMRARPALPASKDKSPLRWIVPSVLALVVAVSGAAIARKRRAAESPPGSIVSSTELVRLDYPAGFEADPEVSDRGKKADPSRVGPIIATSFTAARHTNRDEGVFVISARTKGSSTTSDPWVLSNQFHKDFAKTIEEKLFKEQASITETDRQEQTCLGEHGAAVTATVRHGHVTGTFWTCAFFHDGDAFMLGYAVNATVAADEPMLRDILLEHVTLLPH